MYMSLCTYRNPSVTRWCLSKNIIFGHSLSNFIRKKEKCDHFELKSCALINF